MGHEKNVIVVVVHKKPHSQETVVIVGPSKAAAAAASVVMMKQQQQHDEGMNSSLLPSRQVPSQGAGGGGCSYPQSHNHHHVVVPHDHNLAAYSSPCFDPNSSSSACYYKKPYNYKEEEEDAFDVYDDYYNYETTPKSMSKSCAGHPSVSTSSSPQNRWMYVAKDKTCLYGVVEECGDHDDCRRMGGAVGDDGGEATAVDRSRRQQCLLRGDAAVFSPQGQPQSTTTATVGTTSPLTRPTNSSQQQQQQQQQQQEKEMTKSRITAATADPSAREEEKMNSSDDFVLLEREKDPPNSVGSSVAHTTSEALMHPTVAAASVGSDGDSGAKEASDVVLETTIADAVSSSTSVVHGREKKPLVITDKNGKPLEFMPKKVVSCTASQKTTRTRDAAAISTATPVDAEKAETLARTIVCGMSIVQPRDTQEMHEPGDQRLVNKVSVTQSHANQGCIDLDNAGQEPEAEDTVDEEMNVRDDVVRNAATIGTSSVPTVTTQGMGTTSQTHSDAASTVQNISDRQSMLVSNEQTTRDKKQVVITDKEGNVIDLQSAAATPTRATRQKKPLVITDKDGNVVDFSVTSKSKNGSCSPSSTCRAVSSSLSTEQRTSLPVSVAPSKPSSFADKNTRPAASLENGIQLKSGRNPTLLSSSSVSDMESMPMTSPQPQPEREQEQLKEGSIGIVEELTKAKEKDTHVEDMEINQQHDDKVTNVAATLRVVEAAVRRTSVQEPEVMVEEDVVASVDAVNGCDSTTQSGGCDSTTQRDEIEYGGGREMMNSQSMGNHELYQMTPQALGTPYFNATNSEIAKLPQATRGVQDQHLIADPLAHHHTGLDPFPVSNMRVNDEAGEGHIVDHYYSGEALSVVVDDHIQEQQQQADTGVQGAGYIANASEFDANPPPFSNSPFPDCHSDPSQIIIIENAGIDEVNGTYDKDGFSEGVWSYSRQGQWKEAEHRFVIFQCEVSDSNRYWFISMVPWGVCPGTTADIDFYYAHMTSDCETVPPTDGIGWYKCARGEYPCPDLRSVHHPTHPSREETTEGDV